MKSIPCDIVLLPEASLNDLAIAASQRLLDFNGLLTLNNTGCYAHTSLYMLQLDGDILPKVNEILARIARSFAPIHLEAYRFDSGRGYIDAEYRRNQLIDDLQEQILQALNPLRAGMREKDKAYMEYATGDVLKNLQKYGYENVGKLFRPHLTLTRLKEDNESALEVLEEVESFSGLFPRLGIFEMGDHGTSIRKIATFNLGEFIKQT